MGLCTSSTSSTVSDSTAKLILEDGTLQEFTYRVKVSFLLLKHQNVFICSSEDMEFDDVLTAVKEDEYLQFGELYFALPLSKLSRRLPVEEMVALAVKANATLLNSAQVESCRCRKRIGFFGGRDKGRMRSKVADVGFVTVRSVRNNGKRKMYSANLSAIPE